MVWRPRGRVAGSRDTPADTGSVPQGAGPVARPGGLAGPRRGSELGAVRCPDGARCSPASLVLLYGAYALVDGIGAIAAGFAGRKEGAFWPLFLFGFIGIVTGLAVFAWPGLSAVGSCSSSPPACCRCSSGSGSARSGTGWREPAPYFRRRCVISIALSSPSPPVCAASRNTTSVTYVSSSTKRRCMV
jgi:hypothetical protein